MRIVYVLTSLGVGGAERLSAWLALRMESRGHTIALLVLRSQDPGDLPVAIPTLHLDMKRDPFSVIVGMMKASKFLNEFQPDILHSHSFHANIVARALGAFRHRAAILSTLHNIYEGGRARMLAYRLTDPLSRQTVAVSEAVAQQFIKLAAVPHDKCTVVPNAIELAEFTPDARRRAHCRSAMGVTDEFVWLAVGRAAPAKDYPTLLRAFELAQKPCPGARLWIAGPCFPNSELPRSLVSRPDLIGSVRWLGMRGDVATLLDAADGFVSSSAWEGMPLAIAEAMAMEKPVVATNAGGVRELIQTSGAVVPCRDPDALAKAMIEVMRQSREQRAGLGFVARRRIADRFTMAERAVQWEDLYQSLITCSPSPERERAGA